MSWVFTKEQRFYLHDGETLLDGMMRTHHLDVRYMCRQGYCGACKMQVKSHAGRLRHKNRPLAQLDDDEVLACCCLVEGVIKVNYR